MQRRNQIRPRTTARPRPDGRGAPRPARSIMRPRTTASRRPVRSIIRPRTPASRRLVRSIAQWAVLVGTLAMLARAQESSVPELTLDDAIAQAVANNSNLKTADLEIRRAADDLAANRTRRFANTQIAALGGQLLTKPSVTFQQGSLGVYPATGPIPATNQTINVARKPAGTVFASISQPLSTQYRLHLQLKALAFGVEATRQRSAENTLGNRRSGSACLLHACAGTERIG
jgi:hypothetical protein